ncbi:MAG TPA: TonB family protein [Pyrinomonadaceae bacterium]|nr:TonB family protein [Pyrinomonadaceae bacterium]
MRSLAQVVLTYLLNATWQVALVTAFAALADWLLRSRAAQYRYVLWVITLLACLTIPMFSVVRALQPFEARRLNDTRRGSGPVVITRILTPGVEIAHDTNVDAIMAATVAKRPLISGWRINLPGRLAFVLFFVYSAFLLWKFLLLLRAWQRTQSIVRGAVNSPLPVNLQTTIDRCARLIGVSRFRILHSANVPVPITLGVVKPLIVLPESLLAETDADLLSTAIGHELVHVARRDYLWNLIFEAIYLPLSFHPAVALVRRRIRQMRELCCDEIVATKLLNAETYAHSLMRLIGSAPLSRRLISDTTIGLNQSDILEVRIMSLLNSKNRSHRSPRILLIAAALILIAPCVVGAKLALQLDVYAQEPTATQNGPEKEAQRRHQQLLSELQQQSNELNEKLKVADATQRKELERQLTEVQKNLEEHERAAADLRSQQESVEKLRALIDNYTNSKSPDPEQLKKLEADLAKIESEYPRNDALLREANEKLARLERQSQNRKVTLIYRVEPDYTPDARDKQIEGTVVLGLTVGHDGLPQSIQIKKSLFPSLDESAVNAVRKWRFEPALKDAQPVSMYLQVEFYFAPDARQTDLRGQEEREKVESERANTDSNGEVLVTRRSKERQEQEQEERERRQSELTRDAVVPMDRAIQIATTQVPGKVLACSLGRDGDSLFYHVVIVSTDGNQTAATEVWVSATDGHVIKTEKEKRRSISGGVLNGKATSLPNPDYPAIARAAHASGTVTVEITVDEQGSVVAAKAVSGHPLLQAAAVKAAREAKFTPTLLQGEPVKISGYLTYNFPAQ